MHGVNRVQRSDATVFDLILVQAARVLAETILSKITAVVSADPLFPCVHARAAQEENAVLPISAEFID